MRPLRVIGFRPHLVGDSVFALVQAEWLRTRHPDAYINWVVAAKCSQAAPLFINHPALDRILIAQGDAYQGLEAEVARCEVVFNPLPQHPDGDTWPNLRNVYAESWVMAGLKETDYTGQVPHLSQWSKTERRAKSIAIWPGARQGEKENRRNPPYAWWVQLCTRLEDMGYTVYQCGHLNDCGGLPPFGIDVRRSSFMDLIALSLGCDLSIGTDSGSMVALAAYHSTPTLSLLSPHWPGHTTNPLAFGPLGTRHTNLWAPSNLDHSIEKVVDTVKQLT